MLRKRFIAFVTIAFHLPIMAMKWLSKPSLFVHGQIPQLNYSCVFVRNYNCVCELRYQLHTYIHIVYLNTVKCPSSTIMLGHSVRREKTQKVTLIFKSIHDLAPQYLQDLFTFRHTHYNLRNSDIKLSLPKPRTKRSFSYSGAKLWNDLPQSTRSMRNWSDFMIIEFPHGNQQQYLLCSLILHWDTHIM